MFANKIGTEIADRIYTHYLRQGWLFHVSIAQLTRKIATETMRVTGKFMKWTYLIKHVFHMLRSISIFLYDPKVALIGLC